jgi:hypothetical protein
MIKFCIFEKLKSDTSYIFNSFLFFNLGLNLKNRIEIRSLLQALPMAIQAEHEEVMQFIENYHLMGKGLGYIDMHLLVSAILTKALLWTLDRKLKEISSKLGIEH